MAVTADGGGVLFGGVCDAGGRREFLADTHLLDPAAAAGAGHWTPVDTDPASRPAGRAGHSMLAADVGGRGLVLALFGYRLDAGRAVFLDDAWAFDPAAGSWAPLPVTGTRPGGRAYAAACTHRGRLFVFGGCDGPAGSAGSFRNDMHCLDLASLRWSPVLLPPGVPAPSGRAQAAMVQYGGLLYLFGGNNRRAGRRHVLGDVHVFDPAQSEWRGLGATAAQDMPGPRSGHAMAVVAGGVVCFGGAGPEPDGPAKGGDGGDVEERAGSGGPEMLGDVWVLDTTARKWHRLPQVRWRAPEVRGYRRPARLGGTAV
jgi:hypothetical protein